MLLEDYASGHSSYRDVADHLNAPGYRTRYGNLFTGHTVKGVLSNRFYEGKIVFHRGQGDEEVLEGVHEVPADVKTLWLRCQEVKRERRSWYPSSCLESAILRYQQLHSDQVRS